MNSLQNTFNTVAQHLLAQNAQSLIASPGDACAYRGSNGLKCAVGCLIADEHYTPSLEGSGSYSDGVAEAVRASVDPHHEMSHMEWATTQELLVRLQRMHDESEPSRWRARLDDIAAEFNLTRAG